MEVKDLLQVDANLVASVAFVNAQTHGLFYVSNKTKESLIKNLYNAVNGYCCMSHALKDLEKKQRKSTAGHIHKINIEEENLNKFDSEMRLLSDDTIGTYFRMRQEEQIKFSMENQELINILLITNAPQEAIIALISTEVQLQYLLSATVHYLNRLTRHEIEEDNPAVKFITKEDIAFVDTLAFSEKGIDDKDMEVFAAVVEKLKQKYIEYYF